MIMRRVEDVETYRRGDAGGKFLVCDYLFLGFPGDGWVIVLIDGRFVGYTCFVVGWYSGG